MDADTLRLILIVAGGLLLVGLYMWERRRALGDEDTPHEDEELNEDKSEPRLGTWHGKEGGEGHGAAARGDFSESQGKSSEPEQPELHLEPPMSPTMEKGSEDPKSPLILSIHITPKEGALGGEAIVHAASRCAVEPGEMDVFYRFSDDPESPKETLFTMANMVKPGTFPFGAMSEFESPGLTLFSQAEGASDDLSRLEAMLETAHCLADALDAEIRDGTRALLTPEIEDRLRDRVLELVTWRLSDTATE